MRCAVIGGGWNGIYALKWLVDEGVKDVVLFERLDCIGGTWYHRAEPGGVFDSTRTTASNQYLHASDFPFPMDHNFPHHSEVQDWLQAYIKHFNLVDRIKLSHKVESLRKVGSKWEIIHTSPAGAKTEEFDKVVVATGVCIPVVPMEEGSVWRPFAGDHFHSAEYKAAKGDSRCEGKTVMIVGGGESASDVAVEVSRVAKNTVVSMRRGVWIYDREFGNGPFDVMTPRMIWCFGWSWYNSQLIRTYKFCLELMFGEGGSGIPDWKPEGPFMRSFFNKSRDMVREVSVGRIQARRGATKVEGKKVWFNGRPQGPNDYIEIDTIIWCSGFKFNFEFFKDDPGWNPTISGYKMVFYPDDPTLAFTGTARPIFGSFLGLCELQCRWIAKVFTGKVALPDAMTMKAVAKADRLWHAETFPKEEQRPYVRCHFHYSDEIALMIDAKPHLWSEFLRSPRTYMTIMMAPWNAFQYRLNEPAMREVSLQRIRESYPVDYVAYKQMVWGIWVHFAAVPVILVFALLSLYYAYSRLLA